MDLNFGILSHIPVIEYIEPLSNCIHPKIMLLSRMVAFYKMQLDSPKFCVRYLIRLAEKNMRTIIGKTLSYVAVNCGILDTEYHKLNSGMIKRRMKYADTSTEDQWQVLLALELKLLRDEQLTLEGFTDQEVEELLTYTCTS